MDTPCGYFSECQQGWFRESAVDYLEQSRFQALAWFTQPGAEGAYSISSFKIACQENASFLRSSLDMRLGLSCESRWETC